MAETMYNLCELSRVVDDGTQRTQRWLPVQFAQAGRHVKLKNAHGQWEEHWRVDSDGGTPRPESYLVGRSHAYVGHAKNDGRF